MVWKIIVLVILSHGMVTRVRGQPWYASLNIDVLIHVLKNSIFHPYVASLIPLCIRAGDIPYSDPAFRNTVIYAIFICILWILAPLNEWIAYGKSRRVDADNEVVVITGGANGLGRCLAEIYAMKGTTVAVLDIQEPKDDVEGVEYYICDVSDDTAIEEAWAEITEGLGMPTVLINNAGIANSKSLLKLSPLDAETTFQVNTISHFVLTSLFLESLIKKDKPGTLVTVSSVLGRLGAARLSAYTASKAALIAYHNSVTAELHKHPQIKTILVTPGQLSTEMFGSVQPNFIQRFFGPIVEVQQLAMQMVQMIRDGRGGILAEPAYARWIGVLDLLPVGLSSILRKLAGVDTAMSP